MSMAYIRECYGVPARRGARVKYQPEGIWPPGDYWLGTITSADGARLRIRFDGVTRVHPCPFHPTWGLTYLEGEAS